MQSFWLGLLVTECMAAIYPGSGMAWHSCRDAVGCSKSATSCTANATEVACVLLMPLLQSGWLC